MTFADIPEGMRTEYDTTTEALIATSQSLGTATLEELNASRSYLADLMMVVGDPRGDPHEFIEVMDCAQIGLMYHRYIPIIKMPDNVDARTLRAENNYVYTITALSNAIMQAHPNITKQRMLDVARVACERVARHMRPIADNEENTLHKYMFALTTLGQLVHTYVPLSSTPPTMEV